MRPRFLTRRQVIAGFGAAGCALAAPWAIRAVPMWRAAAQAARYDPPLELGSFGRASAINSDGVVVGLSGSTAAMWDRSTLLDLGSWPGDASSEALAINDAGVIVGASWSAGYQPHAVVWSQGQVFDLGTLAGGSESMALAINERGQAAGWSATADGARHAVQWDLDSGQVTDLGTAGGAGAGATGINDNGVVVGWIETSDGTLHAAVFDQGESFTDLGEHSLALAINASGLVAGIARAEDGNDHAVVWEDERLVDLDPDGSSSQATAINGECIVVGSTARSGSDTAARWDARTLEVSALDGLSDEPAVAYGVNAAGRIVGESGGRPVLWEPRVGS